MTAIGWLMIIVAVGLIRAVIKGQVFDESGKFVLVDYLKSLSEAVVSGDSAKAGQVANTGGVGTDPVVSGDVIDAPGNEVTAQPQGNSNLLRAAIRRGSQAKGYRFGATGPTYYDCSGLMWRAMQDAYGYKLPRFTSHVMLMPPWSKGWTQVPSPQVGDLVLWRNHHVGVVAGNNNFYSARNPRAGIGYSTITGWKGQGSPIYLRVTP